MAEAKTIKVTLVKSPIGAIPKQRAKSGLRISTALIFSVSNI